MLRAPLTAFASAKSKRLQNLRQFVAQDRQVNRPVTEGLDLVTEMLTRLLLVPISLPRKTSCERRSIFGGGSKSS